MNFTDDVPEIYLGAWQRLALEQPGGAAPDNAPRGFWLQAHGLHANICIPADRPDFSGKASLSELSMDDLMQLARQHGYAGRTLACGDMLHRRRQIDYQPSRGKDNIRRMQYEGGLLREESDTGANRATWKRLTDEGNQEYIALRLLEETGHGGIADLRKGYLIVAGDYFIFARDRSGFTMQAESLATLIECKEYSHAELVELLDFEISFGVRRSGSVPWEIRLSTLPFKEGKPLFVAGEFEQIEQHRGNLTQRRRTSKGIALRQWAMDEWFIRPG